MTDTDCSLEPNTPEIITPDDVVEVVSFFDKMDPREAIPELLEGNYVLVEDYYHNGLQVLKRLRQVLSNKYDTDSFQGQRDYRAAYRKASNCLLLLVYDGSLVVKKSPEIGWLKILYDEFQFLISFPDIQGLNSSWQWYLNGLEIDILDLTLHPYYGVYFPTRFDHLELFDQWLRRYDGNKQTAIDVGVGSGVLAFQLVHHGFAEVIGTDVNENAIIGMSEEIERLGYTDSIEVIHGDLFADSDVMADLIVFNPPWLPANHDLGTGIDQAIYYEPDLFPRFFKQAKQHLKPDGQLVILFSNLGEVVNTSKIHPIEHELDTNDRFTKQAYLQQKVSTGSKITRRTNWRKKEWVELWVLEHT